MKHLQYILAGLLMWGLTLLVGSQYTPPPSATATPGGSTTQVQYNSAGSFAGASDVLYTSGQIRVPAGAIGAVGLALGATGNVGFYRTGTFSFAIPDSSLKFVDSGTPTRFVTWSPSNLDIAQTIHAAYDMTFYNAAGSGSGNVVAIYSDTNVLFGPFTGGGPYVGIVRNDSDGILGIEDNGGNARDLRLRSLIGGGIIPAVGTCGVIGTGSKNSAGFITSNVTGSCVSVLTFATTVAATGWSCSISNSTTANLIRQTGSSQTTATFTGVTIDADVLRYACIAY